MCTVDDILCVLIEQEARGNIEKTVCYYIVFAIVLRLCAQAR